MQNNKISKEEQTQQEKREQLLHNLYIANNAKELKTTLSALEVDIAEIVKKRLREHCDFSILTVGAFVSRYARITTNLELMVLIHSKDDFVRNHTDTNFERAGSFSAIVKHKELELHINFMARDNLHSAVESFLSIAPALYNPKDIKRIFLMSEDDLRFLNNLKNGWVLFNEKEAATWKDEFMVELLPIYISIEEYLEGFKHLEKTILFSQESTDSNNIVYGARKSVEHALSSLLGSAGDTCQDKSFLSHRIAKLKHHPLYTLLQSGEKLLFVSFAPIQKKDSSNYLEEVKMFLQEVRQTLSQEPSIGKALEYLTEQFSH